MPAHPDLKRVGPLLVVMALVVTFVLVMATARYSGESAETAIEAGRLDAMMDSASRVLAVHTGVPAVSAVSTYDSTEYAEQSLRRAVIQYNKLLPVACVRHLVRKSLCMGQLWPAWMNRGFTSDEPDLVLHERIDDVSYRVTPFWSALCWGQHGEARRRACQVE